MKDIPHIKGRYYLSRLIAEGEHEHQDFKYSISDARKIARSISAFANNGGGHLLIGVKDNGTIAGVRNEEDIYVVEAAATLYCRPAQALQFTAYTAEGGAVVIKAEIPQSPRRPVQSMEPDGSWRSYFRVKDENIAASPLMVKAWKLAESKQGLTVPLSDTEQAVLEHLRQTRSSTLERIMIAASVSRRTAEDTVVRLASLGIITFVHKKTGFEVAIPPE